MREAMEKRNKNENVIQREKQLLSTAKTGNAGVKKDIDGFSRTMNI